MKTKEDFLKLMSIECWDEWISAWCDLYLSSDIETNRDARFKLRTLKYKYSYSCPFCTIFENDCIYCVSNLSANKSHCLIYNVERRIEQGIKKLEKYGVFND